MLDGLDDINWGALTHAYGAADDVPELLRSLRSADAQVRRDAMYELYGNIFHQGTRYQASAFAVPFLLELAADPSTPDRAQIIRLLACLAIGDGYSFAATGFPIARLRGRHADMPEPVRQGWQEQMNRWYASVDGGQSRQPVPLSEPELRQLETWHELAAYDAVSQGVPLLVSLLADAGVVDQAIYALARFPEHAPVILPALAMIAADESQHPALVSMALVALGKVAPEGATEYDGLLQAHLGSAEPALRWAAAIAMAHVHGSSISEPAVAELRSWAAGYRDDSPETIWEISQPDLALKMLDRVAVPAANEIRSQLVAAELAKTPKSNWHNHFNVVLDRAFPSMETDHGVAFDGLSPAQQAVVVWLIGNPHVFGSSGPDYPLKQHGLPATLAGLQAYAEAAYKG